VWLQQDSTTTPPSYSANIIQELVPEVYTTVRVLPVGAGGSPVVVATARVGGVHFFLRPATIVPNVGWQFVVFFQPSRTSELIVDVGAGDLNDNNITDLIVTNATVNFFTAMVFFDLADFRNPSLPVPLLNYSSSGRPLAPEFTINSESVFVQDLDNDSRVDLFILDAPNTRCHPVIRVCDNGCTLNTTEVEPEDLLNNYTSPDGGAAFFSDGASFTAVALHSFFGTGSASSAFISGGRRTSYQWFTQTFEYNWENAQNFLSLSSQGDVDGLLVNRNDPTVLYVVFTNRSGAINASRFLTTAGSGDPAYDSTIGISNTGATVPLLAYLTGATGPDLVFVVGTEVRSVAYSLEPASGVVPDPPQPPPSPRPPTKSDNGLNTVEIVLLVLGPCLFCCFLLMIPVVILLIAWKRCGLKECILRR